MKEAFLKAMRVLYPEGNVNQAQQRDLIRTYSMGWVDALTSAGQDLAVHEWCEEFVAIADFNWWPDRSWDWWE